MSLVSGFSRAWRPIVFAAVLALGFPGAARCEEGYAQNAVGEGQVKAAFLFNFAKFVQWPAPADGLLIIGIVGDDAFAEIVAKIVKGRSISGRELQTRRLALGDDPSGCHVLFVGAIRPREAAELIQRVRGPVLTVGESVQFLRDGGMVRFYVEKNKMRFEISQRNTEAAGLKVSAQLLALSAR